MWQIKVSVFLLLLCIALTSALDNGLARTPPMGWLDWERFRCNIDCKNDPKNCISERLFKEMADHLAADGYLAAGYKYLIVDDCWLDKKRDDQGRLQANATRFPSGMKGLGDYIHSKGLLYGVYGDIGSLTCEKYPGMEGHFDLDAQTMADWGADYVKIDGCNADPTYMNVTYPQLGLALNKTGRPMVYSCSWPAYVRWKGFPVQYSLMAKYCNLWRNFDDIQDTYHSLSTIIDYWANPEKSMADVASPGSWNDPDMLIIGNKGLTIDESKMQMAIWAVTASPLIMSNDLRDISSEAKAILLNSEAIAVDQDTLGIQGTRVWRKSSGAELWKRPLYKNEIAVVTAYRVLASEMKTNALSITFTWSDLGIPATKMMEVRDIFAKKTVGRYQGSFTANNVPINGVMFLRLTPV
eukprot:TRINITY_DN11862_c0_g1_i1.p1 TRINITY_DN11862_c0_g1~~TRINITY_DN11862_c0_g1_i1.p1  ORF type:complete len:428 (-),score=68.25 TRINITY_DN11862_c0_g1_i1:117-1349(-)